MYKENIKNILIYTIIGYIIVFLFSYLISQELSMCLVMSIFAAPAGYGWHLINKYVGGSIVIGSAPVMIGIFFVKLIASILLGWILVPIALIYNIIRLILELKKAPEDSDFE